MNNEVNMKDITISKGALELTMCAPDIENGYYRGTRFDHSGIFRKITLDGFALADLWFDGYDPYRHDTVCGTSEEFGQNGYEEAQVGGVFVKPGVGLLYKDDESAYDHFKLYRVADFGRWTVTEGEDSATFEQVVESDDWGYVYRKVVRVIGENNFEITHHLTNTGRKFLEGEMYNHNFFTFGDSRPGPAIEIDFPFAPCGHWRAEYDSVALSESGIRYFRPIEQGESVFIGDLKPVDGTQVTGEVFSQRAVGSGTGSEEGEMLKEHKVTFSADLPFHRIAFWSNHRVGCVEPFIPYCIQPGAELEWKYGYVLQ